MNNTAFCDETRNDFTVTKETCNLVKRRQQCFIETSYYFSWILRSEDEKETRIEH